MPGEMVLYLFTEDSTFLRQASILRSVLLTRMMLAFLPVISKISPAPPPSYAVLSAKDSSSTRSAPC